VGIDLRTGQTVWNINPPHLRRHSKLTKDMRTEILVIGAGISGALISQSLTQLGMEVVTIDRRDIGKGSTTASTAMLSYEADLNLIDLIRKRGKKNAVRAYELGVEAIDAIEATVKTLDDASDFRRKRSLYLASSKRDVPMLRREFHVRKQNNFSVELLGRSEISTRYRIDAPCAIMNEDAAEVNPLKLTLALFRSAKAKGLRVFSQTEATCYSRLGKESAVTMRNGCKIRAKNVVFATGYESQQFLRQDKVRLVSSYAISSAPNVNFPKGYERPVIWESARPYLYVRSTADDRILAGGEDVGFVDEARRDALLRAKTNALKKKLHRLLPSIQWNLATSWTGTFGQSEDGLPYIGAHKDFPGPVSALGYGGNGITFSAIASKIIPDLLKARRKADAGIFRFER
jgi:glycine/D-amino acid oxidase-like deaminating enzyme